MNDKQVKGLKPKDAPYDVTVSEDYPGLRIRVSPKGKKTFFYRYRNPLKQTQQVKLTIGVYSPEMTLQMAHTEWGRLNGFRSKGIDPRTRLEQEKVDNQQQQLHDQITADSKAFTVKKLINQYTSQLTKKSAFKDVQILNRNMANYSDIPAADIKRGDVLTILNNLRQQQKFTTANRTLASIRAMYNWAISQEKLEYNPCTQVKATAETPRSRALNDSEIKAFLNERNQLGRFADIHLFLLLTGCRVSEVTGMKKAELFDSEWHIPGERTKNGHPHTVYLTEYMKSLIPGKMWQLRSDAVSKALKAMFDDKLFSMQPYKAHDYRRTISTWLGKSKAEKEIHDRVLNHYEKSVFRTYNTARYDEDAQEWWQKWSDHVQGLGKENVVPLKKRKSK